MLVSRSGCYLRVLSFDVGITYQVLHTYKGNKNADKALIAAEYVGVKIDVFRKILTRFGFVHFLVFPPLAYGDLDLEQTISPHGAFLLRCHFVTVPAQTESFEIKRSKSNQKTIETTVLHTYKGNKNADKALIAAEYVGVKIDVPSDFAMGLDALNTHLTSNTYLVGHSITLADIITVCNLNLGFATVMTKSFTSAFPHVERYFWTVINQPNFKKVVGDVKQTEAVPPIASKKAAQPAKPKEEPKKKAAPAAEAPKPVEEAEEAPKPKIKNPLDLLPPSPMVLDEWKRLYSNTKSNFREVAIKGFWDMYDPEGYSLWFCDYKYNDENMVSFVTLNKVGGFLQRMDLARKYAFGKMLICGSEAPFKVKGLWLFRGPEIPKFIMDEVYDMELYEWTKVDISDEAQKERVSQMIEDAEPFEGEALLDAKCFK
ncbi:hypothetical protein F2Q68_00042604 [Brassica cretica]|uniref:Uncharacterized protein n=2 Tax=Brassica cretica TaxID=69181 RepID=A0A8S9MH74_BRACR|nr:hypothetical protein F2Q68_00042604 [Brassica cretica]